MLALLLLFLQISPSQGTIPIPKETKISLSLRSVPLKQVLREIERQSRLHFFYGTDLINGSQTLDVSLDGSLEQVLEAIFAEKGITWQIRGQQIVLNREKTAPARGSYIGDRLENPSFSLPIRSPEVRRLIQEIVLPEVVVRGKVTDEKGEALPGVSILLKGSQQGTTSDGEGAFSLSVPNSGAVLVFSFVGYISQEIEVGNRTIVNVSLKVDEKALDEVVVVGYGTQNKSSMTAAITTVDVSQLTNIPKPDVISALQGRVAGLTINETSGAPGSSPSIQIRGIGTIDGGTSPLIVIDGVPGGGQLQNIPAYDIESISVLKDASASAIYGARAANGVILITTKRGARADGKPQVEFNSHTGFQRLGQVPAKLNAKEYANLLNEVYYNDGLDPVFDENDMSFYNTGKTDDLHGNTDWHAVTLYKTSPIYTNHLGVSGNGKIGRYYIAGEYMSQRGLLKKQDEYKRMNLRANVTSDLTDNLQLNYSSAYTRTHSLGGSSSSHFGNIFKTPAIGNATVSTGHYGDMIYAKGYWLSDIANVWHWMNKSGPNSLNWNNFIQNANLSFTPVKSLNFNARVGYNLVYGDNSYYTPVDGAWNVLTQSYSQMGRNSYSESWNKSTKLDYQVTGSFDRQFKEHYFKLLTGYSQETYRSDFISASRKDYINDTIYELYPGSAATQENNGGADHWSVASLFGRLNYSLKDRYLLEVNARYDGSSRFAPGKRWGLFPSLSAGWNLHEESFLSGSSIVDRLKLRASWGQLGNSEKIGLYLWYSGVNSGSWQTFDDVMAMGIAPSRFANSLLSWETSATSNIGVDASLWNGKLGFELDFWKKTTHDILLTVPVSTVIGVSGSTLTVNAGKVGSHGFDLTMTSRGAISRGLTYEARFSLTGWNSWLIDIGDRATPFSTEFRPGADLGNMYGYEALGIINDDETLAAYKNIDGVNFSQIKKGDLRYKDQNGDGKLDHRDVVKLGNSNTKNNFGLNLSLGYKGFDFSVLFQGAFNVDRWITGDARQTFIGYASPEVNQLDRWTEENPDPNATYPRLRRLYTFNNSNSDWWIRNGAYLRLKNLQLGYTVPEAWVSKIKLHTVRLFFSATDLFTYAPDYLKGYNPEANIEGYIYPTLRTSSIGLNVKF